MHERIEWQDAARWLNEAFSGGGALLVARKPDGGANPMTIGWGQLGIVWGKPVFSALVRQSRFTFDCLQKVNEFTVCVPSTDALTQELVLCGTRSGRDLDKVEACGFDLQKAEIVDTPIIGQCALHLECKILARSQLTPEDLSDQRLKDFYDAGDLHQILLGDIVAAYTTKPSTT